MDVYSIIEKTYHGNPIIEVLKNGEEFGLEFPFDQNFQFGLGKAKMILIAMDIIKLFVDSNGEKPEHEKTDKLSNEEHDMEVWCTKYNSFNWYGRYINRPYLALDSGPVRIGFGLVKARALIEIEHEIENFVSKYS